MECLLSIVIANYNYGSFLGEAIQSVVSQTDNVVQGRLVVNGVCLELIVCDASSTDNSVEIIKSNEKYLYWWCSESDRGQSDAFNKGFGHSSGKYLTWLNADDLLVPGSLKCIVKALQAHPSCQWFTGNFFRFSNDGDVIECKWGPNWYPQFLQRKDSPIVSFGPTTFFSRTIYERAGKLDVDFHYAMDMDLWVKFIMLGVKQRRINTYCWAFRMHELSKTAEFNEHKVENTAKVKLEREKQLCCLRAGYHMSKMLYWLSLLTRIIDGSLIYGLYKRLTFRKFVNI